MIDYSYQETLTSFEQTPKKYDFNKDLYNNVFNEVYAKDYIGKGYILKHGNFKAYDIYDTSDNKAYEVKRDYWYLSTDNMLVEDWSRIETQKEGWIHYSKADYLIWFITDYCYYIINMYKLQNHFFNNKEQYKKLDIKQDDGTTTRNYLIELDKVKEEIGFDGMYLVDKEYRITDEHVVCE